MTASAERTTGLAAVAEVLARYGFEPDAIDVVRLQSITPTHAGFDHFDVVLIVRNPKSVLRTSDPRPTEPPPPPLATPNQEIRR